MGGGLKPRSLTEVYTYGSSIESEAIMLFYSVFTAIACAFMLCTLSYVSFCFKPTAVFVTKVLLLMKDELCIFNAIQLQKAVTALSLCQCELYYAFNVAKF